MRESDAALEARILAAHAADDPALLACLYAEGASRRDGDDAAFLLTQAWIFALDAGAPSEGLRADLRALGRL